MNPRFHAAIGEAMSRLRTADVAGATAAVQRALAGQQPLRGADPDSGGQGRAGLEAPPARGLRAVLQKLRHERPSFVHTPSHGPAAAEGAGDSENFRARRFQSAAGSVAYKLYMPADHAGRELALVLMLHGCTQNPDDFARGTRMNALADEFGLIVAYPLQPKSANAQGCWNWFDARHQQRGAGEPAVLAGLAQELASEFKIDRRRIFVAGLSAGGAMADILSSAYPDVFSAAGIHSGLPHGAACDVMSAFAAMKRDCESSSERWFAGQKDRFPRGCRRHGPSVERQTDVRSHTLRPWRTGGTSDGCSDQWQRRDPDASRKRRWAGDCRALAHQGRRPRLVGRRPSGKLCGCDGPRRLAGDDPLFPRGLRKRRRFRGGIRMAQRHPLRQGLKAGQRSSLNAMLGNGHRREQTMLRVVVVHDESDQITGRPNPERSPCARS